MKYFLFNLIVFFNWQSWNKLSFTTTISKTFTEPLKSYKFHSFHIFHIFHSFHSSFLYIFFISFIHFIYFIHFIHSFHIFYSFHSFHIFHSFHSFQWIISWCIIVVVSVCKLCTWAFTSNIKKLKEYIIIEISFNSLF